MPNLSRPIVEIIPQRFSCRVYLDTPIEDGTRQQLMNFMEALPPGPFGATPRFKLVTATGQDHHALRGLGTYGFIRGASAFILGALPPAGKWLEDYGYLLEKIILYSTFLELGTCWLGGTFTQSSFARKMTLDSDEIMPAVVAMGYIDNPEKARASLVRKFANAQHRLPWEKLFFAGSFSAPLPCGEAGRYTLPLEMVRIGPSASNKQPWRVVRDANAWHFYLHRTPGYRRGFFQVLLDLVDLQRIDLGIAMCHFESSAREAGLQGEWVVDEPPIVKPDGLTEYSASWVIHET